MKDDILNIIPDFESLLRNKGFAELSSNEKASVMQFMTIEEYESMRSNTARVIELFSKEEKNLTIDKNLEPDLVNRLRKKKEKSITWILSFCLAFRVPVYQVAILLLAGFLLIPKSNLKIVTQVLSIFRIDTVFIEKSINSLASDKRGNLTSIIHPGEKNRISKPHISKVRPILINQSSPYFANIITHFQSEKNGHAIENDSTLYNRLLTLQLNGN